MSILNSILNLIDRRLSIDAQLADIDLRATNVDGYRKYYDGEQILQLTTEQLSMLRLIDRGFGYQGLNANYMDRVVDTKADRLVLERIEADTEAATTLLADLVKSLRLDRVSSEVHSHTPRDGDNFVMVSFDKVAKRPRITEELAYDGESGVIPVYRSSVDPMMYAAIKVWQEYDLDETVTGDKYSPFTRVNIYYPDKIEKYVSRNGTRVDKYYDTLPDGSKDTQWPIAWVDPTDQTPLGIPIFHFRWNPEKNYGKSVLDDAIPVQDGYNRAFTSLIMTAELTAFRILAAFGFTPPSAMTPGGWILVGEEGLDKDTQVKIEQIQAGDLTSLLSAVQFIKGELHDSTNTPNPSGVGKDASGESRKQIEVFLLGELQKAQRYLGETWESVFETVLKLYRVFGGKVIPEYTRLYARYKPAEIRDNSALVENAVKARPDMSQKAFLQVVAPVFEWDNNTIDTMIADKKVEDKTKAELVRSTLPDFGTGSNMNDTNVDSGSSNSQ